MTPFQHRLGRLFPAATGQPRVVWLLVAGRTVNQLGAFTLPFLAVALTRDFGVSVTTAGLLLSTFGAATIVSRLFGGWLAGRLGHRSTIVVGLGLTAIAQLSIAGAPDQLWAGLAIAVLGLAFEIYEPSSQALIADYVGPSARPAAYGLLAAGLAVAAVAAGLLAALLAGFDVRWLFVVDAVTTVTCAVLLGTALPRAPTPANIGTAITARPERGTDPPSSPWRDPRLLVLLLCGVVFAVVYLQLSTSLALTLTDRGLPPGRAGLLFALSALIIVLGRPLLSRGRLARWSPGTAMAVGYALLGTGLLGNGFAISLPQFLATTVLWSLGDLLLLGRVYALVADLAPDQARARYFSVYGLSWGIAGIIGPICGTQLLTRFGPPGLWAGCALACGGLAVAQRALHRLLAQPLGARVGDTVSG